MKSKILKIAFGCACALGMSVFVACGAESSGHSTKADDESSDVADLELADGKAVVCDDDMEGVVAITKDDGYRKCEDGEWKKIKKSEALKADEIIGLVEDDDDEDADSDDVSESSNSKNGSSSSRRSSFGDDEEDDSSSSSVKSSSSSVIPSGFEESSGSGAAKPMDYSVEKYDDIPTCTAKREGSTVLVEYTGKKYVCEDGGWIALTDANDEEDFSVTISEKCSNGLTKGCLVGSWALASISNVNDGSIIMPYSSGTLKIYGNGEFAFTTPTDAGSALAQNGCGGVENYGRWTIDDAENTVTFKVTVGDCLYGSATFTAEISATELNLKGMFFLRADLTDATTSAISTEVYIRM